MTTREPAASITTDAIKRFGTARIVLCGSRAEAWTPVVRGAGGWKTHIVPATAARDALTLLREGPFDLIVLDLDGLRAARARLLHTIRSLAPHVGIVCIARTADRDLLLAALREGVVDVLSGAENETEFRARIAMGLEQGVARRLRERRLTVLETACRRLSRERETLNRQLGGVVSDLAQAQERTEERIALASAAAELRAILTMESDTDAMLKLAAQAFVLRMGAANCAVFVERGEGRYDLCGYLRDDVSRSAVAGMLDTIADEWCASLAMHGAPLLFDGTTPPPETFRRLQGLLPGRAVCTVACREGATRPAVLVLFRDADRPFANELAPLADALGESVAACLTRIRRIHGRAKDGHGGKGQDHGKAA
ncbi:MAG: hypothetical protein ACO3DS_06660 [Phycisphaerales bacterium]|jgi:DNA-binding NarL/FixJ family response regulator